MVKLSDKKCEYFKLIGELEDNELMEIWVKFLNGEEYVNNKEDIVFYMEKLGLLVMCYLEWLNSKVIFWYFVLSMRKGKFDEISVEMYIGFIIFCFEFKKKYFLKYVFYGVVF